MEIIPVSPQWYAGPPNHNFSLRDSFSNEANDEYSTIRLLFTWQGKGKCVFVFPATLARFSPKGWFGFTVTINLLCWTSDPVKMRTRAISNIKRQNSLGCAKLPSSWHPEKKNRPFSGFSQSPPDYQQTTLYSLASTNTCALLFCLRVADQALNTASFAPILSNKTLLLYQFCP